MVMTLVYCGLNDILSMIIFHRNGSDRKSVLTRITLRMKSRMEKGMTTSPLKSLLSLHSSYTFSFLPLKKV